MQVTDGLNLSRLAGLLKHSDEYVRSWAIQFLCDTSPLNGFQDASDAKQGSLDKTMLTSLAVMAKNDPSPVVRLYLASAVQRLPFADRWEILEGLLSHGEDIADNNLPRMYWFGLEPMVPKDPQKALQLTIQGKIPTLQAHVARRMVTREEKVTNRPQRMQQRPQWQGTIQKVAPGFKVHNVGEGGVVHHKVFRNETAVQTHPLDRKTPSRLVRKLEIPENKKTRLIIRVSHHPHGDWQLKVLAAGQLVTDQIVGPESVSDDEWLDVSIDLTKYAGRTITLSIENHPNNWRNEWAYWNRVSILSE